MDEQRRIKIVERRDQGRVRQRQEDHCATRSWPDRHLALFIVADGMGGHAGGELASATVVETVLSELEPYLAALQPTTTVKLPEPELAEVTATSTATRVLRTQTHKLPETSASEQDAAVSARLRAAIQHAQEALRAKKRAAGPGVIDEAGSTLTLGLVIGRRLHLAYLGDSRAYLWRQSALRQLTRDHSGAALLAAAGVASTEQGGRPAAGNLIYRFLGGSEREATAELSHLALEADDLLLFCSDGLWGMLPDSEIAALLIGENNLEVLAQALIDAANGKGGEDNITVVLATL